MYAIVTDTGKEYTTYKDFALKHGYPDAAAKWDDEDNRKELEVGDHVKVLTEGKHGVHANYLYIIECENGEKHIIDEEGVTIVTEHNGRLYREVKRKAREGELVKVTGHRKSYANGIFTVGTVFYDGHISYGRYGRKPGGYVVLEPVADQSDSTDHTPQAYAVRELESKVAHLEADGEFITEALETNDEVHARRAQQVEDLSENLRTFAMQTTRNQHDIKAISERLEHIETDLAALTSTAQGIDEEYGEQIEDLSEKAEMAIDDIVRLDERTQTLVSQPEAKALAKADVVDIDALIAELEEKSKYYADKSVELHGDGYDFTSSGAFGRSRGLSYAIGVIERYAAKTKRSCDQ